MALSVSLILVFAFLSCIGAEAREYLVGGKEGAWKAPSSSAPDYLNKWAEKSRFQVGDTLVWKYDSKVDSVLEVTREAYLSCSTASPIAQHKEGETKIKLDHPGPYYYISGADGHCDEGQKMIVVVMTPRHHKHRHMAPSPSPSAEEIAAATAAGPVPVPSPAPLTGSASLQSASMTITLALGALLCLMI